MFLYLLLFKQFCFYFSVFSWDSVYLVLHFIDSLMKAVDPTKANSFFNFIHNFLICFIFRKVSPSLVWFDVLKNRVLPIAVNKVNRNDYKHTCKDSIVAPCFDDEILNRFITNIWYFNLVNKTDCNSILFIWSYFLWKDYTICV